MIRCIRMIRGGPLYIYYYLYKTGIGIGIILSCNARGALGLEKYRFVRLDHRTPYPLPFMSSEKDIPCQPHIPVAPDTWVPPRAVMFLAWSVSLFTFICLGVICFRLFYFNWTFKVKCFGMCDCWWNSMFVLLMRVCTCVSLAYQWRPCAISSVQVSPHKLPWKHLQRLGPFLVWLVNLYLQCTNKMHPGSLR